MRREELLELIETTARRGLTVLDLSGKRLTSLPPEIGNLKSLQILYLGDNQLTSLPPEVGNLKSLRQLYHGGNQLTTLPPEIGNLKSLREFYLYYNQLASLPPEIGNLKSLWVLGLWGNQLTSLPPEIGNLKSLQRLYLSFNQLTSLPREIGKLKSLQRLDLRGNQLTSLPPELAALENLETLNLDDNPLISPPPDVVKQGMKAVLAYLRELGEGERRKWEAKLLIVGEAGVGKTELVKALHGDDFGGENPTEGVLIRPLPVRHSGEPGVEMRLNLWDFGGQEIQHATHQFFYSERALFVLTWNARENYAQAKLNDWLELIQARASELPDPTKPEKEPWKAPVLLVATHRDLWHPDIPFEELKAQFPRIRFLGILSVSKKPPRRGIRELRSALAEATASLPLMGMKWPVDWQRAEDTLAARVKEKESRMLLSELWRVMKDCGVNEESQKPLARALDSMGKIRVFLDDEQLRDTVILDPQWLTSNIARVLKNEDAEGKAICHNAILERGHWQVFWPDEETFTNRLFVRMMRKFDLLYELEDRRDEAWLVVQLLPFKAPKRYRTLWKEFEGQPEITMKFRLEQLIPPGIPTWFIAREHRFSLNLHWRLGVLLANDPKNPKYLGLVRSYPELRYLQLTVRGTLPRDFFALLKDGLEFTLNRYPGMSVQRKIPCPCPKQTCEPRYEFDFDLLEKRKREAPKKTTIECPKGYQDIPVIQLLYAEEPSPIEEKVERLAEVLGVVGGDVKTVLGELRAFREEAAWHHRTFLNEFRELQERPDDECPNVFTLRPAESQGWVKGWFRKEMVLQLYCQEPGHWHPTVGGGQYKIHNPAKWMKAVAPYVRRLCQFLKYTMPLVGPGLGVAAGEVEKAICNDLKLMGELVKKLPEIEVERELRFGQDWRFGDPDAILRAEGAEWRALRVLLDELDPAHGWGGLKKVHTPEGHYLWLCRYHAEKYK